MLPVVWIAEANEDLLDARAWYDNILLQLGERFATAVEATVEAIAEHLSQYPVIHRDVAVQECGAFRAEYSSKFKSIGVVIACFHGRRDPRRWHCDKNSMLK